MPGSPGNHARQRSLGGQSRLGSVVANEAVMAQKCPNSPLKPRTSATRGPGSKTGRALLLASSMYLGHQPRHAERGMSHYKSNRRDIEFNLFEVLDRQQVLGTGPFAEVDEETARDMLAEVERL